MKTCPKCNSRYTDVTLKFCLQDGAVLADISEHKTEAFDTDAFSNEETVAFVSAKTDPETYPEDKTVADEPPVSRETIERPPKRPWRFGFLTGLLVGAAVLGVIVAIGFAALLLPGYLGDTGNANTGGVSKKPQKVTNELIEQVTASSFRRPYKGILYIPENVIDGDDKTAWCDGAAGAGKGEWIKITFTEALELDELTIKPGYFKNAPIWIKNNRAASVRLQFSNGQNRIFDFPDEMTAQKVELKGVETSFVKLYLDDVHMGTTDITDTMISEISFTALR